MPAFWDRSPALLILRPVKETNPLTPGAKVGLTALLAVYGFVIFGSPYSFRIIDNVDLAIHGTGHLLFGPFGEFLSFLGGTLFQVIVPLTFFGYFLRQGDRHSASVLLWWVAQNCWNISVYVKDARSQELPLVGGEHDWTYLLYELDLLVHDQAIGQAIYVIGIILFAASIGWGLWSARAKPAVKEK